MDFPRQLAMLKPILHWSMWTLREKLIKIGAKVVRHARYTVFHLAEVAVSQDLFRVILGRISQTGATVTGTVQEDRADKL